LYKSTITYGITTQKTLIFNYEIIRTIPMHFPVSPIMQGLLSCENALRVSHTWAMPLSRRFILQIVHKTSPVGNLWI
jgi:hypothetical protein